MRGKAQQVSDGTRRGSGESVRSWVGAGWVGEGGKRARHPAGGGGRIRLVGSYVVNRTEGAVFTSTCQYCLTLPRYCYTDSEVHSKGRPSNCVSKGTCCPEHQFDSILVYSVLPPDPVLNRVVKLYPSHALKFSAWATLKCEIAVRDAFPPIRLLCCRQG